MPTTPYWGELPTSMVARGNSVRRDPEIEDGYSRNNFPPVGTGKGEDRLSNQFQPQRRQDRNSTQTEAPTVSTQSPFISPTESSFRGAGGLAPRPPSFPYEPPGPAYNNDYLEKRHRRQSRNREQQAYEDPSALPPAAPDAPDAPRPPPVSYKQQSTPSNQTPARSRSTRRSEGHISSSQGVANEYYQSNSREGHSANHSKSVVRRDDSRENDERLQRCNTQRQRRQGSISGADSQKPREWASPLQRLELRLDGITKEAELLAREIKTANGSAEKPKQNSVRFRNQPVAKGPEKGSRSDTQSLTSVVVARQESTKQNTSLQRSGTADKSRDIEPVRNTAPVRALDYVIKPKNFEGATEGKSSTLQRGMSTRDRSYIPVAVGDVKLGRSGSNKLRKEPPGDSRLHARVEAEKRYLEVGQREPLPASQQAAGPVKNEASFGSHPQGNTENELPVLSRGARRLLNHPLDDLEFDSTDDMDVKPVRRKTLSKVEQLTGQKFPQQSPRSAQPGGAHVAEGVKTNTVKYGIPTKSSSTQNTVKETVDSHKNIRNILHQNHQNVPGQGVYVPSGRLDEWKKGGVAQLSGSLLDLEENEQAELDKDKTWWEPGNTGKRRRSTTKQRKAEAYDGEYDDSNGTPLQFSTSNIECAGCVSERNHPGRSRKNFAQVNSRPLHQLGHDKSGRDIFGEKDNLASETPQDSPTNRLTVPSPLSLSNLYPELFLLHTKSSNLTAHSLTCPTRTIRVRPDIAPTRFKPPLFLRAGPLLRYCGLRRESAPSRVIQVLTGNNHEREIWKGSIMIVTQDEHSSYELAPTLRLFLQPMDLIPPPPAQIDGEGLAPEYVDPLAGLPKIGRDGRTLYIRPVEDLEEERDLSKEESDAGLFETVRSAYDGAAERRCAKPHYDGEKAGKYKEVRGFRLHAEQGVTFWRFNVEIELREKQQRIAYRINRGPSTAFWIPARGQPMNIMFHSCNGFSYNVDPQSYNGPDPLWRDVLNNHQTQPFHVMLGGGDQIYNDSIMENASEFKAWTQMKDPLHKETAPFSEALQDELESFYLNRYCMWFSQGLFGLATSQIPMINIFDDHDIIDGYGSYPDPYMCSPVMRGLGAIAFKYYMLFQHQSSIDEGEETEPHWILGDAPGPYIGELSRSIFTHLGRSVAFLGLDCRTERMNNEIVSANTYEKVFDRLEAEIIKGETKHLIVMVGIPVAYPRMVWLENILTSRFMDPIKALGRAGLLGKGLLNHFDGGAEILDDLDDHWTAKHHKEERNWFIQELQDLAAGKSVRITILGGDVHLGAMGQFYSNPKLKIRKDHDHRYMPNIISSAIVNAPPPDTLADVLNKRNKVHHLDADTEEDMIPIFTHDVNGRPRNNKCLLNRRNWCSIKAYDPELSLPPTPQTDGHSTPPPTRGGIFRRLSSPRGPNFNADASAPPLSNPGFFNRRPSISSRRGSTDSQRPGILTKTLSLTRRDSNKSGGLFRRNSKRKPDSGGINGYGADSDDDSEYQNEPRRTGIRGGGNYEGESYFPAMDNGVKPRGREPKHPVDQASTSIAGIQPQPGSYKPQFHRTPTDLARKKTRGEKHMINLEGGLDICLNVEVSHKDPAGITMPYRLLVPALWYQEVNDGDATQKVQSGLGRWLSLAKRKKQGVEG